MRFVFTSFFIFAVALAFGFSCKVTCPPGYSGACVGDQNEGCSCSCEKDNRNAKLDILKALKAAGASPEFQQRVERRLANVEEFAEQTLTDEKASKKFTIMLKKQE